MTSTLVVHTGALGDFLMACPAIEALHGEGPVVLVGSPERHALAVASGIAEHCVSLDVLGLHEILATEGVPAVSDRFRDLVSNCRGAVVWMRDPGGVLARAFVAAGIEEVRCFPGLPGSDWAGHASAYYLDTIGLAPVQCYCLSPTPRAGLDVVVAPGSGSPRKNWPIGDYVALADHFTQVGRRVTWLLGPAEAGLSLPASAEILREPELPKLAGQLAGARLFIGNDSGTTHLSAVCACPTIAIHGPLGSMTWDLIGPKCFVVRGKPWPSRQDVLQAIFGLIEDSQNA